MDWIFGLVGTLVGIFILLQAISLIVVVGRLVKMALWAPVTIPIQRALAIDALPVLDAARPVLGQAGFLYTHTRRVRSIIAADLVPPGFCDVYYHASHDIHAEVYVASMPAPGRLFDVYLWNNFIDGSALLTTNGLAHTLIPYPHRVTIADGSQPDFAGQIATHLQARERFSVERTPDSDALRNAQELADQLFPQMEQDGHVYRRGSCEATPVYGFRLKSALKSAWRLWLHAVWIKRQAAANKSAPPPASATPTPATVAAERIAFVRTLCTLNGNRAPRWFRWSTFVLSALGFLALGTWWWGVAGAVTIVAVVLLHEAGHWLAMKLAHFRDVQVFFVPGMGGATSGEKHDANPLTNLAVYLAGPVPGLLLSLAVFAWVALGPAQTNTSWYPLLLTGATAAFLINALNLLPVLPLDGGRVIELFVLGRLPWLRFIFAIGSGGLLLAAGVASGDNVTRAIGIILLIGAQYHFRIAKVSAGLLRAKLAQPLAIHGFPGAATQLYDFLAQPGYRHWNNTIKISVGMALLPRFLGRLPSWKETLFGLLVYLMCAVLPLAAMGVLVVIEPNAVLGAIAQGFAGTARDTDVDTAAASAEMRIATQAAAADTAAGLKIRREQRSATLATTLEPAQRFATLKEAIDDANEEADYEDAQRLAKLFYDEANERVVGSRDHAEAALLLGVALRQDNADQGDAISESVRLLRESEAILRKRLADKADREDGILLARVIEERTSDLDDANLLPMRREIVKLYTENSQKFDFRLTSARTNLARSLEQAGQTEAAEAELRSALADVEAQTDATSKFFAAQLRLDFAWLMLAHHHPEDALRAVAADLAPDAENPGRPQSRQRDAHLIAAMVARQSGDWNGVKSHALAVHELKPPQAGSWFWNLMLQNTMLGGVLDRRASLLLIEAERALGQTANANQQLTALRKTYAPAKTTGRLECRMLVHGNSWLRDFQQTLAEIEQREVKCTPSIATATQAKS